MLKTSSKSKRPTIIMPSPAEDRLIIAAAKLDPDAQPLTKGQLAKMVPLRTADRVACVTEAREKESAFVSVLQPASR